jgi:hypothetical protein
VKKKKLKPRSASVEPITKTRPFSESINAFSISIESIIDRATTLKPIRING